MEMAITEWSRGKVVGRGSFATVSLAHVHSTKADGTELPALMAVKSAPLCAAALLRQEESVLSALGNCPHIIRCFGHGTSPDPATGALSHNLFLEYAPGGSLHDALRRAGGKFQEPAVRRHARSVLRGLRHVHARGYAHCDLKPQNILIGACGAAKIADFGLAVEAPLRGGGLRGTPIYVAPEVAARGEYGPPADVWALGCTVAEMASSKPAWACSDVWELLFKIGFTYEAPEIPTELSEQGRDFLRRCFARDPRERWSAEDLLKHPFVAAEEEEQFSDGDLCCSTAIFISPTSVLRASQIWSPLSSSICSSTIETVTPGDRISSFAAAEMPNWSPCSSSGGWIDVRNPKPDLDSVLLQQEMASKTETRDDDDNGDGGGDDDDDDDGLLAGSSKEACSASTVHLCLPLEFNGGDGTESCSSACTRVESGEAPDTHSCGSSKRTRCPRMRLFCSLTAKDCDKSLLLASFIFFYQKEKQNNSM